MTGPLLSIGAAHRADAGVFGCQISDDCGTVTTRTALVTVLCAADFSELDGVNSDGLGDYLTCFFATQPCAASDFNRDGRVDPDDLAEIVTA